MRKEFENLHGESTEAAVFISRVTHDAAGRLTSRIYLDEKNYTLEKLPIGGEEGLDAVLSFIPLAKEGFALDLRADELTTKSQISDVLRITTPETPRSYMENLGYKLKDYVVNQEPRLTLFRHSVVSIGVLSSNRQGKDYPIWPYKPSVEDIWNLLDELEETTKKMVLDRNYSSKQISRLRAVNFFATGNDLAKSLL